MGVNYALFRRGPLTMAPSQLGAFTRSDPSQDRPNLQYHIQPLSLDKFGDPLHPFPAFTASVANLRPTSRGAIKLKSADPAAAPAIRPNYLATPEDRRVAAESIRIARRISAQPALARYKPVEYLPGPEVRDDDEASAGKCRRRHRHHHLPSGRHRPDGPHRRPECRGRCPVARDRAGWPAG